jgi:antitoxin HicB
MYTVTLTADDNGTILVTCPDLPEVTTFGEDEEDAVGRAADAIEEALAARIARRENIPAPSAVPRGSPKLGRRYIRGLSVEKPAPNVLAVSLPPLTEAKIELYRAMRAAGLSKAELARRLGWHGPQMDRLLDLNHRSRFEYLEQALRAIGKRIKITVADTL